MNKVSCGTAPAAHSTHSRSFLLAIYKEADRTGVLHSVPQPPGYESCDGREHSAHSQSWAEATCCYCYSACYCFCLLSTCDLSVISTKSHY